ARAPPGREGDQLRAGLRPDGLRAGPGAPHPAGPGPDVHRELLRPLRGGARVHAAHRRRRARHPGVDDPARAPPAAPRDPRLALADRAYAERIARNTPIQGSAADLLKLAMIRVDRAIEAGEAPTREAALLLTVHDELVFEVPIAAVEDFKRWVKG